MNLRKLNNASNRRKALEKELGVSLSNVGSFTLDESMAGSRNCENMIGATQIPLGVAGPMRIQSFADSDLRLASNDVFIPLATTEGALVASVNRGCKAITESGSALVDSNRAGATRGPVFRVDSLQEHRKLCTYIDANFEELKRVAQNTSSHLTLKTYTTAGVGKYRYVRFVFDTQDAMGLNMVTIATDAIVSFIKQKIGIPCISLSGNFCVDKKPSWQNVINCRGIAVWAEVTIPARVLSAVCKTTAQKAYEVWLAKCMIGSAIGGSMGFNAQYANVIAALFIATGQDPAHVVEGSLGITTAEIVNKKDLYISIYLPDLMVGTVGGGTGLATQKEAFSMLGVRGGNDGKNSQRFAEIIGGAVLAGEISLLSSLEEGTLARAHQALARGKGKSKSQVPNIK
jgi:hydroxymethylglutaryl-CoA reductase (NADPH)